MDFLEDLPGHIRKSVEKSYFKSPEEVINTSTIKLLKLQDCTEKDIKLLKEAAAKSIAPRPKVAVLLQHPNIEQWSRITFGCSSLDKCTGGGIVTRGITEIYGEAGVGKTQIILQLSFTVQLPTHLGGLGKDVAFISTENFPSRRIFEMAQNFSKAHQQLNYSFLNHIHIEHVIETDDLLRLISERIQGLLNSVNIGLIIIDSVAAVFRLYSNYVERAKCLRKMANCLLHYAHNYNLAVVCVNQVASSMNGKNDSPCLGLAWAHLGRTRIKLSKSPKQITVDSTPLTVRRMEVIYSPEDPSDFGEFLITSHGVVDVPR